VIRLRLNIPSSVRSGEAAYRSALRHGQTPTGEQRAAHAAYKRARLEQRPRAPRTARECEARAAAKRAQRGGGGRKFDHNPDAEEAFTRRDVMEARA
jgi:hypothetical protein